MNCSQCNRGYCFSSVPIFQHLSTEHMEQLSKNIVHKTYYKGETVFSAGELNRNLFIVRKGIVKISRISEEGRERIIRILQPGDFFGELSLFKNTVVVSSAIATELTEVCVLEGEKVKELFEHTPKLLFNLIEQLSDRLERAESQLDQTTNKDVSQRLAQFILQCYDKHERFTFKIPVSKTDLASMLGTTRETLSRRLNTFQKDGYIKCNGKNIEICNVKELQKLL